MCKVSSKTIIKANQRTRMQRIPFESIPASRRDAIVVRLSYNGKLYSQELTIRQMRESYGRALKNVKNIYGRTK